MNLKAMAMVSLAGLVVAATGCGNLADAPVAAWAVRYASDGTLVVFGGWVIDSYGPDLTRKLHIPVVSENGALFSLSDDGSVAALGSSQVAGGVGLLDLSGARGPTMTALGQSPAGLYSYAPQGLTLSPHGDLLFVVAGVGGQSDVSGMFDTSTGARLWTIEASYGVRAFFSPDGSTLYVLGASPVYGGGLQGFDSRTGTLGLNASLADSVQAFGGMSDPNTLIGVAISVDPTTYAESTEIDLISTADGSRTGQVVLPANTEFAGNVVQPAAFHCAPAAGLCALDVVEYNSDLTAVTANAVQVWAVDGTLVQSIDQVSGDVGISPDGQYVAVIYDGDVTVYRVSDGSVVKFLPYRNQVL
jgi:WD40 repeat protein